MLIPGPSAKALKSKIYEGRLANYVHMFDEHKREIEFRLQVHTARAVDHANKKLDGHETHLKLILQKMDELFRKLDTPREREVLTFIEDNQGAQACLDNDATLSKLISKSGESVTSFDPTNSGKAISPVQERCCLLSSWRM
jgi:hypothetical protein